MLNENKDCDDNSVGYDANDMYSVVTDANWSDGDEDITHLAAELNAVDDASNLGLLILDGEDSYVEGSDDEGTVHDNNNNNFEAHVEVSRQGNNDSRSLSIPDTLSLPSGLRSMLASGFINEQDEHNNMGEGIGDNDIDPSHHAVRLQAGRFGKFKMINSSFIVMIISVILLLLQSWRMQLWRNEALRIRNEFHKHRHQNNYSLLPLTLSLAKERNALLEKQGQLEEIIERLERNTGTSSNYEDNMLDQSDADKILSIKTCYLEASLSLGRCAKDWQDWWYNPPDDDISTSNSEESDSHDDDYSFDTDLSMLAKSLTETLVATTVDSYSFVEKAVKDLSYAGIKDALYTDNYTSGISGQTTPDTEDIDGENYFGCAGGFQKVLSKLINGSEDAADEATSKLSLWNW
jgi:hypothetical protein